MGKFACIVHPLDISLVGTTLSTADMRNKPLLLIFLKHLTGVFKCFPPGVTNVLMQKLIRKTLEWLPTFECSDVTGLKSAGTGEQMIGNLICCALLPDQIMSLNQKFVLHRLIEGGKIAQRINANILGLGAYTSQPGNKGVKLAKSLDIPVTTGTHYTIATAIEAVAEVAKKMDIKLEHAKIGVIGATGSIGRICSQVLAETAGELILAARNKAKLETLADNLRKNSGAKISILDDLLQVIKNSDITIMATSTPEPLIDIEDLQPGTIICDISRPRNVSMKKGVLREDVLVIDGGVIKPPGDVKFNFYFGLPEGLCYACMAEAMILALEGKYESYSIGGKVCLEKVKGIADLGRKHGFRLANIRSFDNIISPHLIEKVRVNYNNRRGIK